jgi:hypothetical protein
MMVTAAWGAAFGGPSGPWPGFGSRGARSPLVEVVTRVDLLRHPPRPRRVARVAAGGPAGRGGHRDLRARAHPGRRRGAAPALRLGQRDAEPRGRRAAGRRPPEGPRGLPGPALRRGPARRPVAGLDAGRRGAPRPEPARSDHLAPGRRRRRRGRRTRAAGSCSSPSRMASRWGTTSPSSTFSSSIRGCPGPGAGPSGGSPSRTGSLLFTDEPGGRVNRVSYGGLGGRSSSCPRPLPCLSPGGGARRCDGRAGSCAWSGCG